MICLTYFCFVFFFRKVVCNQVIRSIVDKIERKEKDALRKVKKQEMEDEKQKKIIAAKLQGALFKHKEAVKKEILKKRALMEKNLQQDIQVFSLCLSFFHLLARKPNLEKKIIFIHTNSFIIITCPNPGKWVNAKAGY